MNVYDFDKTILNGDSTAKFYFYCLGRYPAMLKHIPATALAFLKYALGFQSKTAFKEVMYRFLREVPKAEEQVEKFWDKNISLVFDWYYDKRKDDDVVISASPEFLVVPACKRLGIKNVMASRVDIKTGLYDGENCHGEEKVRRFRRVYPNAEIDFFCSDSLSDTPLAKLSKCSKLVSPKGELLDWNMQN